MPDYSKSWSRKQWTKTTEGVLKNIIDAIKQGQAMPKGFLIPSYPIEEGFSLYVDPPAYEVPYGVVVTKVFEVCVQSNQNWAGTVNLSQVNNLCAGSLVTLEDDTLAVSSQTPKNCTLLRAGIPATCPPGVYTITVTGVWPGTPEKPAISRVAYAEITVGTPPEEEGCKSDVDCEKYGLGWHCVNGECLKDCSTTETGSEMTCNSDLCPAGEKCVWNASVGKCLCKKQEFTLSCPASLVILPGTGKTAYGVLTIGNLHDFTGTGSVSIYDSHQPGQAPSTCATAWLEYRGQTGNIIPITLEPNMGEALVNIVVSASCEAGEADHYFCIEVSLGGKFASCCFVLKVTSDCSGVKAFITYFNSCNCCPDCVKCPGCFNGCGNWQVQGQSSGGGCSGTWDLDHCYQGAAGCPWPVVEECVLVDLQAGEYLTAIFGATTGCPPRPKGEYPSGPCGDGLCDPKPTYIIRTETGNEATFTSPGSKTMSGKWCE